MMRDPVPGLLPGVDGAAAFGVRAWPVAAATLGVVFAWIVGCYWGTFTGMVAIWERSETFAHGFAVAPISAWLVWRARAELAALGPRPSWWILVPMGAAGAAWALGELGSVNALSQFSLVALIVLAVPAVLGATVARAIAFPLGFLFFMVPIGEFMMPQLMEWTADFTVKALQLSGIPVFREGQSFLIPSGRWSVVEACSGVRYLIASLVVGTLYAYLSYRSLARRLVFVAVSIAVPIVANWIRAYTIVMIGHLSGNTLAVGVDHLIYGWVFFGAVIMLMFWFGARWREDSGTPAAPASAEAAATRVAAPGAFLLAGAMLAAITAIWPLGLVAIERGNAASTPSLAALGAGGGWSASTARIGDWRPRFRNPSTELEQTFTHGENAAGIYIGYYRGQSSDRKLVASDNVLVTSGDKVWSRVASGTQPIVVDGQPVDARTALLKDQRGRAIVAWYWYWIDGRLTASDSLAKAYTALSRLTGRGDDGAVVVVYAGGQPGAADAVLAAFVRDMGSGIRALLERTRDRR